ncbi:MAG: hypothetical protein D3916_13650 [Candidatus Electrothrix sp. MAN1_4]|nr:hypothetical protein [Candidatus Electrothrix sp. MAN1_4]
MPGAPDIFFSSQGLRVAAAERVGYNAAVFRIRWTQLYQEPLFHQEKITTPGEEYRYVGYKNMAGRRDGP